MNACRTHRRVGLARHVQLGGLAVLLALVGSQPELRGQEVPTRHSIPLADGWEFRTAEDPPGVWKPARVSTSFETFAGIGFDGVGSYRIRLPRPSLAPRSRAFLNLEAAATEAVVTCDGQVVGSHLGGWTPFRVEITDPVRARAIDVPLEIEIRVDEKVGHNTQGFLPIIQPHFGGIWQNVALEIRPDALFDERNVLAIGDPGTGDIRVEVPILGDREVRVTAAARLLNAPSWSNEIQATSENGVVRVRIPIEAPRLWSPETPNLYEVRLRIEEPGGDELTTRAAFRSVRVDGSVLRLNGRALSVRGLLNWGFYPPELAPVPDEERFRSDLEFARSRGFNLMKFCLWIPPRRYLELCDELGMLAWVEYPTWHPQLDQAHKDELLREYREFFAFDRNHPSVILRSLTCETGPSADLDVVRSLYDLAHAMVPGAVVEDDSSWIGWQRVHDFFDDHPYGNNQTWVATLDRLNAHIREHEPKPLILGEAIAADTWLDRDSILELYGGERPYWFPGFFDANAEWSEAMLRRYGPGGFERLRRDSERYAFEMRKYQIETFRREVPAGGYVVSVIRDFPLASMGLIDPLDRPKWPPEAWSWHGETMLLLETPGDRRAFTAKEMASAPFTMDVSHFGDEPLREATLSLILAPGDASSFGENRSNGRSVAVRDIAQEPGTLRTGVASLPPSPEIARIETPQRWTARAELRAGRTDRNSWPLWGVPEPSMPPVALHESVDPETAELFLKTVPLAEGSESPDRILVARRFDDRLLDAIERGARVLMMPDGTKGSFALSDHWFLRGGPYLPDHAVFARVPREFVVELQHFDLAGPVIPRIDPHLDAIDPIVLLWDNHDIREVRTHGLVFEMGMGRGRVLVSALNHGPSGNAAGRWLLGVLLDHLAHGPSPRRSWTPTDLAALRERINERAIDLVDRPWRFRPDPANLGLEAGWHRPETVADEGWTNLNIDRHWESQGFDTLDGWAWYRLDVEVPKDWAGRDVYLSFRGVDDYYEAYVDGRRIGSGGDIATRRTAFEERTSHLITGVAVPGRTITLAIRVHDWYGAGGIFRPVSLGTARIGAEADWIR